MEILKRAIQYRKWYIAFPWYEKFVTNMLGWVRVNNSPWWTRCLYVLSQTFKIDCSFHGNTMYYSIVFTFADPFVLERVPPRLLTRRTRRPNEQFGMRQPINVNDHPQTHLASTVHRTFPRRQPLRRTFQNGMVPYPGQTSGSQRSSQHMYPEFPTLERPLAPRVMYPNRMNLGPPGRYFAPTRPFVSSVTATRKNTFIFFYYIHSNVIQELLIKYNAYWKKLYFTAMNI